MSVLLATNGRLLYNVCRYAFRASNISFQAEQPNAVLVWNDTVKNEFFDSMQVFQVINRLPWAEIMCQKVPFVSLVRRMSEYYPDYFDFLPKSYVLPAEIDDFEQAVNSQTKEHIYKPNKGSHGHGIQIIPQSERFEHVRIRRYLAVAQEYIDSVLLDDRKFDLRIYALVASLRPLKIYVYREGVARFCTEKVDSDSVFATLTNTAINSKNPEAVPETMTRSVRAVLKRLQDERGCDITKLWERIENVSGLTLIAAYGFLLKAEDRKCPNLGYPRCFQVIGFDILLDRSLNPYVLEINCRPSMKSSTEQARNTKFAMLRDALRLACPYLPLQTLLDANPDHPTDPEDYGRFIAAHPDVLAGCEEIRERGEVGNGFSRIYPHPQRRHWDDVVRQVLALPTEITVGEVTPPTAQHSQSSPPFPQSMRKPHILRLD
jgi:hypothetical protein